jgi:hypothetical protein
MKKYRVVSRQPGCGKILAQFDRLQPRILPSDRYMKVKVVRLRECAVAAYLYFDAIGWPNLEIQDRDTGMSLNLRQVLLEFRSLSSRFELEAIARSLWQTSNWPSSNRLNGMISIKVGNARRAVAVVGKTLTPGELAMVQRVNGQSVGGAPVFFQ